MRKYDKASLYAELDSQLKQARLRSANVQKYLVDVLDYI